ncbi:hypothetical protein NFHSH190041_08980 [Shewanella sp. NFH-SH190041]|uniref:hypothetical protein n=1 Tax=Shewanella sp. NFH-SH190041 TaxID=2950245 RepID=UPI0021C3ECF1|nr:hypothetical protein [Shewanella sp. NFH-SH190041]BDM63446.1 hypothetical protein NFHSH190041_08980 [Shewanella sp. NFH-SH190041]
MNFQDPDLVLVKIMVGEKKAFFQVIGHGHEDIALQDIDNKSIFSFTKKDVEILLEKGKLKVMTRNELPQCLVGVSLDKHKIIAKKSTTTQAFEQLERRYSYVKGVIDERIPAFTAKQLEPYIEKRSLEIMDDRPPNWRTLTRWIKLYLENGCEKKSLLPRHAFSGNYNSKINLKVGELLDSILNEYLDKQSPMNYNSAYNDFLERLECLNNNREEHGLGRLQACSYNSLRKRFKR